MYKIIENQKVTNGTKVCEQAFQYMLGIRLRKNALHYVREIMQNDYREKGYATEPIVGGIFCYKSIKDPKGNRIITEIEVKVEKA